MRIFRILFFNEIRTLAISMSTYVAGAVFLLLMGGIYWVALGQATYGSSDSTPAEDYFKIFWLPLLFIVPLITMRSFPEERRIGTLAALLSTPVRPYQIVLAKFGAAYALYLMLWLLAMLFPVIAWLMLKSYHPDPRLLSPASLQGGFAFIAVSGLFYVSVGILAASLTRSTLVAALLSFCGLFLLVILGSLLRQYVPFDAVSWTSWLREPTDYFDMFKHLESFTRGVVDTRPLFLFGSGTLLAIGLTTITIESKA